MCSTFAVPPGRARSPARSLAIGLRLPSRRRDAPPAHPAPPPGCPATAPAERTAHSSPGGSPTRGHCAAGRQRARRSCPPGSRCRPAPRAKGSDASFKTSGSGSHRARSPSLQQAAHSKNLALKVAVCRGHLRAHSVGCKRATLRRLRGCQPLMPRHSRASWPAPPGTDPT